MLIIRIPKEKSGWLQKSRPKLAKLQIVKLYSITIEFLGRASKQFLHRVNDGLFLAKVQNYRRYSKQSGAFQQGC